VTKESVQQTNPIFSPDYHIPDLMNEHFTGTDSEITSDNNSNNNTLSHY